MREVPLEQVRGPSAGGMGGGKGIADRIRGSSLIRALAVLLIDVAGYVLLRTTSWGAGTLRRPARRLTGRT